MIIRSLNNWFQSCKHPFISNIKLQIWNIWLCFPVWREIHKTILCWIPYFITKLFISDCSLYI